MQYTKAVVKYLRLSKLKSKLYHFLGHICYGNNVQERWPFVERDQYRSTIYYMFNKTSHLMTCL